MKNVVRHGREKKSPLASTPNLPIHAAIVYRHAFKRGGWTPRRVRRQPAALRARWPPRTMIRRPILSLSVLIAIAPGRARSRRSVGRSSQARTIMELYLLLHSVATHAIAALVILVYLPLCVRGCSRGRSCGRSSSGRRTSEGRSCSSPAPPPASARSVPPRRMLRATHRHSARDYPRIDERI